MIMVTSWLLVFFLYSFGFFFFSANTLILALGGLIAYVLDDETMKATREIKF